MGIYSKSAELVDGILAALERGEPMIVLGPHLMERGLSLMETSSIVVAQAGSALSRSEHVLGRIEEAVEGARALLELQQENALLERRKLALEILKLEKELGIE